MIKISQEKFENLVRKVISGETTRTKIAKELKTDRVTLNNKIQELAAYNSELYKEFIEKFPYKPREYTHIDWRAMLIDIMKKGYTKEQAAEQYEITSRTIARKVYKVEDSYIVDLYRKVSYYKKHQKPLPLELKRQVDALPIEKVFLGGICDKREEELDKLEENYNFQLRKGEKPTVASAKCGKSRATKDINTLYRIRIEKNTLTQSSKLNVNKGQDKSREER